jgi:hypothetical protein
VHHNLVGQTTKKLVGGAFGELGQAYDRQSKDLLAGLRSTTKGVFGRPGELRFSHLTLDFSTSCCLVGRVGLTGHCPPRTKNASQPCPGAKLKSSFSTRPS